VVGWVMSTRAFRPAVATRWDPKAAANAVHAKKIAATEDDADQATSITPGRDSR